MGRNPTLLACKIYHAFVSDAIASDESIRITPSLRSKKGNTENELTILPLLYVAAIRIILFLQASFGLKILQISHTGRLN